MKVLTIEPARKPKVDEIDGSLKSMQKIVGGHIETIRPFKDKNVVLVCNEEGKLLSLTPNRELRDRYGFSVDIIYGTFFLCEANGPELVSLSDKNIAKYSKYYR